MSSHAVNVFICYKIETNKIKYKKYRAIATRIIKRSKFMFPTSIVINEI